MDCYPRISWKALSDYIISFAPKEQPAPAVEKITSALENIWGKVTDGELESLTSYNVQPGAPDNKIATLVDAFYKQQGMSGVEKGVNISSSEVAFTSLLGAHLHVISDWSMFMRFAVLKPSPEMWDMAGQTSVFGLFTGPFAVLQARERRLEEGGSIVPDRMLYLQSLENEILGWLQTATGGAYAVVRNPYLATSFFTKATAGKVGTALTIPLFALIAVLSAQSLQEVCAFESEIEGKNKAGVEALIEQKRKLDLEKVMPLLQNPEALAIQAEKQVQKHLDRVESLVGEKPIITAKAFLEKLDMGKIKSALNEEFGLREDRISSLKTPEQLMGFYYACKKQQKIQEDAILRVTGSDTFSEGFSLEALKDKIWEQKRDQGLAITLSLGGVLLMGTTLIAPHLALGLALRTLAIGFLYLDGKGLWNTWQQEGPVGILDKLSAYGSLLCSLATTKVIVSMALVGGATPAALLLASVGVCWVAVGVANIAMVHLKDRTYREKHLTIEELKGRVQVFEDGKDKTMKIATAFKHTLENSFLSEKDKKEIKRKFVVVGDLTEFKKVMDEWKQLEETRKSELKAAIIG